MKNSQVETMKQWDNVNVREKYYEIFIIMTLFAFGIYHSVLYFGHQVVPNPDFFGYYQTAVELLSLQRPSDYRTLPVLGLFQKGLSYLVGGQQAELTAGWLLNAILHPFNIILVWLVGKRIIGRSALWVAIIVAINPWVLNRLTHPTTETTFLFFILLTFYFIFRQSKLSYLVASIASMVRYEGVVLILVAFIMDLINHNDKRERVRASVYAVLAVVPFAMWTWGAITSWDSHSSHFKYISHLGTGSIFEKILSLGYIHQIWRMGFYPLFSPLSSIEIGQILLMLSKVLILASFTFGAVYGLWKRRWNILALLIFLLPYILVHSTHALYPRHWIATHWIILMICLYGLQNGWQLIVNKGGRVPKTIITVLQCLLLVLALAYLIILAPYLLKNAPESPSSMSVPYIAGIIIAVVLIMRSFLYNARHLWPDFIVSLLICSMVVSNQFVLVNVMGKGQEDLEFKLLAEWYLENADPDEKMVSSLKNTTSYFASGHEDSFIHYKYIKADSPADFIRYCNDMDITYVAWDSRVGLRRPGHPGYGYYKKRGRKNVAMLERPQNVVPYEFITQIYVNERRFINIFRLQRPVIQ